MTPCAKHSFSVSTEQCRTIPLSPSCIPLPQWAQITEFSTRNFLRHASQNWCKQSSTFKLLLPSLRQSWHSEFLLWFFISFERTYGESPESILCMARRYRDSLPPQSFDSCSMNVTIIYRPKVYVFGLRFTASHCHVCIIWSKELFI